MGQLTLITFIPVVGAAIITMLPKNNHKLIQWTALVASLIVLIIAVSLYPQFDIGKAGINNPDQFQFVEKHSWIPVFNINYYI